jgi:hypothetical protein
MTRSSSSEKLNVSAKRRIAKPAKASRSGTNVRHRHVNHLGTSVRTACRHSPRSQRASAPRSALVTHARRSN